MQNIFAIGGYVVIRFDFSGTGESDGSFYDMTLTRELKEARLIVDFTNTLSYIDKNEISGYGHSLGGVIATLLACELKPKIFAPFSSCIRYYKTCLSYKSRNGTGQSNG
jgi:alpha/beta superfamily hydrolase